MMNDRHQVINDQDFWAGLEHGASQWLRSSDDKHLRQFWIDGFLPEYAIDTSLGVNIRGKAWDGIGGKGQLPYLFIASIPQKLLHRGNRAFTITQLSLDEAARTLQMEVGFQARNA